MNRWSMYIDGEWVQARSSQSYDVINPATAAKVGEAPYGDGEDARLAVLAADRAFKDWSRLPAKERAAYIHRIADIMGERKEELAEIITLEMGKPLSEARSEVLISMDYLRWNAEEGVRNYGHVIPAPVANKRLLTVRQPVGSVAAITPWNFPLSMAARKLGPALVSGCTVVLKPALQTPGAAVKWVEIAEQAGLPKGVVNLVTGNPEGIGNELLSSPEIKKITFTGSTAVGKKLLSAAAGQVKKMSMELGGHAPFIIFDDADLDMAVIGALNSKFRNAGQTCICANRIYVHASVAENFLNKFKEAVGRLRLGDGFQAETTIGPVIDRRALDKVEYHVSDAVSKGASIITGGKRMEGSEGYFYEPTILSNVDENMVIMNDETFGPVAPVHVFHTEEEVIAKANNTPYGLAAYFYTRDMARTIRVYEALEYGIIGCNDAVPTTVQGPFGGWKESGMGREGGPGSINDFLETKFVSIQI
ncbi:NAD-dependent succinate-semialdehyde dehydrogenase [Paenibacillus hamazuiensis]|uniref:NAD-dependent succinate-semialdehyde dehydrogenase n=1 Tax=Paenibacillus hamazuiensis TaxID=2936508 RepID=UPI00200C2AA9|nr:NAD-dependent succinate-semialdehyde dehydrogenase [Paenibacillus hamazuiensis]